MNFVQEGFPAPVRKLTVLFAYAVCGLIYGAMGWVGLQEALAKFEIREFLMGEVAVPLWPGRFFVPVGCFAIAGLLGFRLFLALRGKELEAR